MRADDRLVIRDRRVAIVDEVARRRLEANGAGRDGEVAERHLRLERAARPDPDERRPVGDGEDLGNDDLDVVGPDPGRDDRNPLSLGIVPVADANSRCRCSSSTSIEARGDAGGPVLVAGEQDVLGEFAGSESDVVLPFAGGDRDPAVRGASTRGSAFGKTDPSLRDCFAGAKLAARIARRSDERQAESGVLGPRLAVLGLTFAGDGPAIARQPNRDTTRQTPTTALAACDVSGRSRRPQRAAMSRRRPLRHPGPGGRRDAGESRDGRHRAGAAGRAPAWRGRALRRRPPSATAGATGSPPKVIAPAESTTTTGPSFVTSTRPMALIASSGSIRGSCGSASPATTIRPTDVPSSSVNPVASRATTSPPTRTSCPENEARSARSASTAPAVAPDCPRRGSPRQGLPGRRQVRPAPVRPAAPPLTGRSARRDVEVRREARQDREAVVAGTWVRAADDPGHRRGATLGTAVTAIPEPGWPTIGTRVRSDDGSRLASDRRACARSRSAR